MADFPGDISRICQRRADALMEICPELLKDNVVQKKKGGNKVFWGNGATWATVHTPRATCNSPAVAP